MDREETTRTAELQREIRGLDDKDLQLWSMGLLVIVVLAAGFAALVLPNVMWNLRILRVDGRYLPQLFFGFVVLIVLFNIYALQRRRLHQRTRDELVRELVRREAAEKLSLVDPLTELYNRRYLDQIMPRELSRADRLGTPLTFLMLDVDNFKSVNTRFGHLRGDRVLSEVAQLLKRTFRTSDTVVRYGGDEFLVVMTETNETQAQPALERLLQQVDRWNRANSGEGFTLSLSCGLAAYSKGENAADVLHAADQRMYVHKARQSPAS